MTDATQLRAIMERTCGNGWQNMLRAIDKAGWVVMPKLVNIAQVNEALASWHGAEDWAVSYEAWEVAQMRADMQGIIAEFIAAGALRLPADGGKPQ